MAKYTLNESIMLIEEISGTLVLFLGNILEVTKTNKIQLVGIGNSISAGWTAIDNNVQPWIKKLSPFIKDKCEKAGIDIGFEAYTLAGSNSNEKIYEFLKENPTLEDVRERFICIFDLWKTNFKGTPFENLVDKDQALQFYNHGKKRFFDCYDDSYFTITSFNGCTGELLDNIAKIFQKNGLNDIMQKELYYMQQILILILRLSTNSYATVGNFPKISRNYLMFLNTIIDKINQQIENVVLQNERTMYFDKIALDFVQLFNGKVKIDNHPDLAQQYYSLYQYIIYLMNTLPLYIMQKNEDYNIDHYKSLDYDGNLKYRVKRFIH